MHVPCARWHKQARSADGAVVARLQNDYPTKFKQFTQRQRPPDLSSKLLFVPMGPCRAIRFQPPRVNLSSFRSRNDQPVQSPSPMFVFLCECQQGLLWTARADGPRQQTPCDLMSTLPPVAGS